MMDVADIVEYAIKGIWAVLLGWLIRERKADLKEVADRPTKEEVRKHVEGEIRAAKAVTSVHLDNMQEDIREIKHDIKSITRGKD